MSVEYVKALYNSYELTYSSDREYKMPENYAVKILAAIKDCVLTRKG